MLNINTRVVWQLHVSSFINPRVDFANITVALLRRFRLKYAVTIHQKAKKIINYFVFLAFNLIFAGELCNSYYNEELYNQFIPSVSRQSEFDRNETRIAELTEQAEDLARRSSGGSKRVTEYCAVKLIPASVHR